MASRVTTRFPSFTDVQFEQTLAAISASTIPNIADLQVPEGAPSYRTCKDRAKVDAAFEKQYVAAMLNRQQRGSGRAKFRPRGRVRHNEAEFQAAVDALANTDGSMEKLLGSDRASGVASLAAVRERARHDDAFAAVIGPLLAARSKVENRARPKPVYQPFELRRRLRSCELYVRADEMTRGSLEPWHRDDVRSELILAMLEGDDAPDVRAITSRVLRGFNYSKLSIDMRVGHRGGEPLVDLLTSDVWTFEGAA